MNYRDYTLSDGEILYRTYVSWRLSGLFGVKKEQLFQAFGWKNIIYNCYLCKVSQSFYTRITECKREEKEDGCLLYVFWSSFFTDEEKNSSLYYPCCVENSPYILYTSSITFEDWQKNCFLIAEAAKTRAKELGCWLGRG